jgi:hypothetical protein
MEALPSYRGEHFDQVGYDGIEEVLTELKTFKPGKRRIETWGEGRRQTAQL